MKFHKAFQRLSFCKYYLMIYKKTKTLYIYVTHKQHGVKKNIHPTAPNGPV